MCTWSKRTLQHCTFGISSFNTICFVRKFGYNPRDLRTIFPMAHWSRESRQTTNETCHQRDRHFPSPHMYFYLLSVSRAIGLMCRQSRKSFELFSMFFYGFFLFVSWAFGLADILQNVSLIGRRSTEMTSSYYLVQFIATFQSKKCFIIAYRDTFFQAWGRGVTGDLK